jgi:glyceraldehyde-3-phosphate dehydrogenase (ferredoxin)
VARLRDLAVYVPFGKTGHITPNYYLSPGVFAPLPVLGRYWTMYGPKFGEPEEIADAAFERALAEYLVDNAGFCRFHRAWVESILQQLYKHVHGVDVELTDHAKKVYRKIAEYQLKAGSYPTFWESAKVIELLGSMACEYGSESWCEKFRRNPREAAWEWWIRFLRRISEHLGLNLVDWVSGGGSAG